MISVVIPTYKRPDRILRAVKSALDQSAEVEVIVVDDNGRGSDAQIRTEAALKSLIDQGTITYLVNEKNGGGSHSRNQGLWIAKGEYITFLDDDDEIDCRKLEKQVKRLEQVGDSYTCCYTGYHKLMEDGSRYCSDETIEGYVYPLALARAIYVGSGSNLLVRTEKALEIHGYDERFRRNQDLEFMTRLLRDGLLAYVDEDLMTIHYEIREVRQSYETMKEIADFYQNAFKEEIDALPGTQGQEVRAQIALELWKCSLTRKASKEGFRNLRKNHVTIGQFLCFIGYLTNRVLRKKSYGFKLPGLRKACRK